MQIFMFLNVFYKKIIFKEFFLAFNRYKENLQPVFRTKGVVGTLSSYFVGNMERVNF
jgi:hypothetical protein